MADEYYENDEDLDIDSIREDYEYIWGKNIMQVDLIRETNKLDGDYFGVADNIQIRKKLWMNVQGINSDIYKRMMAGVITPDATLHAYVKWDEDIENLDVIKIGSWYYRIIGFNKSMYAGQFCFKDFDLKRVDRAN